MLRVPFDTFRLYDGDDPEYELWLSVVADRVEDTLREQNAVAKKGGR
jgi:hypothetical protein